MTSETNTTKGIIARLLSNLGSAREVDQYLKQFASVEAEKFAVIKVGGGIIEDNLDALASALTFLDQVGLFPIVIHGAGPQLDSALAADGIRSSHVDGMRVTSPEVLDVARRTFQRVGLQIVEALEGMGTRARPIGSGVFEAELLDQQKYGLVGRVTRVHLENVESSIRSGHLPILACLGETASGQILNVNADVAARELATSVKPYKIIFLTPTGGLLDDRERVISAINLSEDYDHLIAQPWVHSGMQLKLQEIKRLLDKLPPTSSVSITSPQHLARELFTHQGSGTLIRQGERIGLYHSFDEVDQNRLRELIETCFGGQLDPAYYAGKQCERIYLADSYRATAVITHEAGEPYLDKFAVTPEAQGLGLGASVWNRLVEDIPRLYWRSRSGNKINTWYFQQAQGHYRSGEWVVFWYGMDSYDQIKECVEHALAIPATVGKEAAAT